MKYVTYLLLIINVLAASVGCSRGKVLSPKDTPSKVVNIIDQMPAENSQIGDELAAELVALNPEATILLSKMLLPPDDPNDNAARFGLSALTHYVARNGAEAERKVYAAALIDALAVVPEKQNKAFLISQMQLAGKEEVVSPLANFLNDDLLCDCAARALITIGGPNVEAAFLKALDSATGANQVTLIKALGELKSKPAVEKIASFATSKDRNTRDTTLYALANIGDPSSQEILRNASRTDDAYQRSQYTALYLLFAQRQAEQGDVSGCARICTELIQQQRDEPNIRTAAANTLRSALNNGDINAITDPELREQAQKYIEESLTAQTPEMVSSGNEAEKMNVLTDQEKSDGFERLFNGKDLTGWVGDTDSYGVKDGVLFCRKNTGTNIYTENEYSNFILRFEFKLDPGTNNGLGIRTPLEGDAAYVGMELQVLDNTAEMYSNLHAYQYHGSIYGVVAAKRGALNPVGTWNVEEVIADGTHITVKLNGQTIVDADIKEASQNGTIDGKEHPGLLNKSGHIGFLGHGDYIEFRNIRLKSFE
jgi:hypothetical protein